MNLLSKKYRASINVVYFISDIGSTTKYSPKRVFKGRTNYGLALAKRLTCTTT